MEQIFTTKEKQRQKKFTPDGVDGTDTRGSQFGLKQILDFSHTVVVV